MHSNLVRISGYEPVGLPEAEAAPLSHVLYLSSATQLFSQHELAELLTVSRRNNKRDGVTGVMLYDDGTIIQVIEGPTSAVEATWKRISRDPRHKNIIVLTKGPISHCVFDGWDLGFEKGCGFGGFHLDEDAVRARVPENFPPIMRTMMRVFSDKRPRAEKPVLLQV